MKKMILMLMAMVVFGNVLGTAIWTDSSPWDGAGIGVEAILVSFPNNFITFKSTEQDQYYVYKWGTAGNPVEMTSNAKAILALLTSAHSNSKKVAVFWDDVNDTYNGSCHVFTELIVKN